jgi:hypothetical protein
MMNGIQDLKSFSQLIAALDPWLDQIVIVGGWAHQLYRLHPHARALDYRPLTTLDTDVAIPARMTVGDEDIRQRLVAHGFVEDFVGDHQPPAVHYHLGSAKDGFYAEFLTPLTGGEYDRKHNRKATMEIAGIASQQLRHIELLLHRPWSIDFQAELKTASIRIANPVSFMAQKILIQGKRDREDRAKDILYMHDTLEVFGSRLKELRALWQDAVQPQLSERAGRTVLKASESLFGELSDDIRRAVEISAERVLSPEGLREACRYGFTQVFG